MLQPGRAYKISGNYRYGFGAKEDDDEVKGNGNQIAYENRIYDPRLARWISVDPLQKNYPDLTPYNFSGNSPIVFGDYDGKDFGIVYDHRNKKVYIVANYYVTKQEEAQAKRALSSWNAKSAVGSDGYTVVFSLKTKVPEMQTKEEFLKSNASVAKLKKSEQEDRYKRYADNILWSAKEGDPNGNAYFGSDFQMSTVQSSTSGFVIGGVTNANYVYMNKGDDGSDFAANSDLVGHEFGHTLGLQDPPQTTAPEYQKPFHSTGGIMEYTTTGSQFRINNNDVTKVYDYARGNIGYQVMKAISRILPTNNNFENRSKVGTVTTTEEIGRAINAAFLTVR